MAFSVAPLIGLPYALRSGEISCDPPLREGRGGWLGWPSSPSTRRRISGREEIGMRLTGPLLIVLALSVVGCARGDWTTETLTLVDVTGTWEGVFKFSEPPRGLERTTRWVLRQKGGRVRGEAEGLEGAQLATIEGQVNGEVLSWQLTGQFFKW